MQKKAKTRCTGCGRTLIVPNAYKDKKFLCTSCREKQISENSSGNEETIGAEKTVDESRRRHEPQTTVRLGRNIAATRLIKEVLKVEPTVDLDHTAAKTVTAATKPDVGRPEVTVSEIITSTQAESKYIFDRTIGKGGMGAVLSTVDQDIRRKVAMKVMLPKDSSKTPKVKRFLDEAQITGQLEHPNIVPVHEIGIDEESKIYFTMKLVQGEDLETIIARCEENAEDYLEKFSLGNLIQVFMKLCDGISYAHSKQVIHRDLKPENIMIGSFGEVLVMDWGIAKVMGQKDFLFEEEPFGADDRLKHTKTMEGIVLGTPAYMSPEQARGQISELDERSDIFSLGAILYKILTFHAPYEGETLMAILKKAQKHEFVSPDMRLPQRNIPPELNAICMKAMACEKENRYASVLDLKKDLQLYLDGKSVSAKKDSLLVKSKKWIQRNKIAAMGIAAAVLCLIAGVIVTSVYENNKKQKMITDLLVQGEQFALNQKYGAAEKTYFAVLGLDTENAKAREGIARVSSKALAEKNRRLAEIKLKEANMLFENKEYIKSYDAFVATLSLDPMSRGALEGIKISSVMAEKQKNQMKIAPILQETRLLSNRENELNSEIEILKTRRKTLNDKIEGYEGAEVKKAFWETDRKLFDTNLDYLKVESEIISNYLKILSYDGTNKEARRDLTRIYYEKYLAGEMLQNKKEMAYYKTMILTFDDGTYEKLLEKPGNLTLKVSPQPDAYYLFRFMEGVDRRMIPVPFSASKFSDLQHSAQGSGLVAGIDPQFSSRETAFVPVENLLTLGEFNRLDRIANTALPAGSYLIVLKKQGFIETRLPLMIQRGKRAHISGIHLYPTKDVPKGFVYIPQGKFIMGGDQRALNSLDRSVKEVSEFFISQHEVTSGDYLKFINYMEKRIPGSGEKYLPRKSAASGFYWKKVGKRYQSAFPENWPILGVSWNDARAYCDFMGRLHKEKGWSFRLPEEWEWEKAARGVDGRYFPWGNFFDYKFCMMANSSKKKINGPVAAGSFSMDESVYGVKDLAGNVSEWCNTLFDRRKNIRINRGGAWSYVEENFARCAYRNGHSPSDVADFRGFRMVVDIKK